MAFKSIVCLVDDSPAGLEALRQAAVVAAPQGELLGVVACDLGVAAEAGFEAKRAARQLQEEALQARDAASAVLRGHPSASVEIVDARPAQALLGVAKSRSADLLVLGTQRRTRHRGIIMGSLITEIIHRTSCPVLVARGTAAGEPWAPRAITVGVDGSPNSLAAYDVARALGQRLDAAVGAVAATGGKRIDPEAIGALPGVEWSERRPVDALVTASEHSDLLVVGCRGLHGLASLGSVSERVAHRAACSVLVICHERAASHGLHLRASSAGSKRRSRG
jgi:nucleotide-binding universal stress UspA family protein